jgi:predicted nucleotide-binding protein
LFPIYSQKNLKVVLPFIEQLRRKGIDVWFDMYDLKPGADFEVQIDEALRGADVILVFASARLLESASIVSDIGNLLRDGRWVVPVLLEEVRAVEGWQKSGLQSGSAIRLLADDDNSIKDAAETLAKDIWVIVDNPAFAGQRPAGGKSVGLARDIASQRRSAGDESERPAANPESVFIAHGHDETFLNQVEAYIRELGIEPVVLRRIGGPSQSLFQKFLQWGKETRFAIVLLSADDLGAARYQFEASGVGDRALQFRARQNVILEMGFFYGHLGWENVFVLYKNPDKVFPNFERPSDLEGVVFDLVDESEGWKDFLRGKLVEANFKIK